MKKIAFLIIVVFALTASFISNAYAGDLDLKVIDNKYVAEGKVVIHYSFVNNSGSDYADVTVGFKVIQDGNIVGCKQIKQSVPKNSDGSETSEATIDVPSSKNLSFESIMFSGEVDKKKIDEWFAGCTFTESQDSY
jgi:hypothetical protein